MYHYLHQATFYLHVLVGSAALIIFWLPLLVKKGSAKHRQFGKLFVGSMITVAISGLIMSLLVLIDPIAVRQPEAAFSADEAIRFIETQRVFATFLLMLSILVFSNVRQSILVLEAKSERQILRTRSHLSMIILLGICGVIVAYVGWSKNILLLEIFAGVSIFNSIGMLHYIFKAQLKAREWIIAHLGNIIGAGIGAYTAFFAFGGRRMFAELLTGNWLVVPWVLPAIVGLSATVYFTLKYRAQYRVA